MTEPKKEAEAPVYAVERLVQESEAFLGAPSHVAVGAFHGVSKKNLTIAEAKQLVERWLKRPAEVDNAEEAA